MFDIGLGELILIGAIALIAIGPKQLPEVAVVIGRMLNEFKRAVGDVSRTIADTRESATSALMESRSPKTPQKLDQSPISTSESQTSTEPNPANKDQLSFDLAAKSSTATNESPRRESE